MGFKKMVRVRDEALTEYLLAGRSCGKTYEMQKWLKGEKNDGDGRDLVVPYKYVRVVPNWHFYDVNRVLQLTCN